jgi:serine/threonine protein kinase
MLSGGKLIDEGMYGCIFKPPLKCKNKPEVLDKTSESDLSISKLILSEYADDEFSIAKTIGKIPLWKNYFVISESMCEPAKNQKEPDLGECPVLKNHKLSEFKILRMPYGGTAMTIHTFDLKTLDFMDFVSHFIQAGALLNLFGVVHRDIHQGNILVDKNDVPRIIDFNLSLFVKNKITTDDLRHVHDISISQEPPDSTLVNGILMGYSGEKIVNNIINKKSICKKIRILLGISEMEMYESLDGFYNKSKSIQAGDDVAWFKQYWRTIDSWAIGINLVDLVNRLLLWPEFSQTLRKIKPKLFPVLRGLCAVSPLERIDCVQALEYLEPNNFIIRKYGKAWLSKVGTFH